MTHTLQQHLSRLDEHSHRSAYLLSVTDNFSPRKLNKALRERMRLMSSVSRYTSVWVKVDDGLLFLVSGPLVVTEIAYSFLSDYRETGGYTESQLYRGTARKLFHEVVQTQLAGYVQSGRSYGASR
ncbi:hypothetical protein AEQ67_09850 [Pseudomonas sp. RIT-PI-q]|nr:hypothetical protein AEQ67_09850 [Pseudomonas sp. RIT-PI-q]